MLYDLLNVYAPTHWSSIPGNANGLRCSPSQTMWQYGSSLNTATSRPRTRSAIAVRSAAVATPPVGLCGVLRKIAFGRIGLGEEPFDVGRVRAELAGQPQRGEHRRRPPPDNVRHVCREARLEDENLIARVEERFAKELLERFGPGRGHDVLGRRRDAELVGHHLRCGGAELGQSERRAVLRPPRVDGRLAAHGPRTCYSGTGCPRSEVRSRPCPRPSTSWPRRERRTRFRTSATGRTYSGSEPTFKHHREMRRPIRRPESARKRLRPSEACPSGCPGWLTEVHQLGRDSQVDARPAAEEPAALGLDFDDDRVVARRRRPPAGGRLVVLDLAHPAERQLVAGHLPGHAGPGRPALPFGRLVLPAGGQRADAVRRQTGPVPEFDVMTADVPPRRWRVDDPLRLAVGAAHGQRHRHGRYPLHGADREVGVQARPTRPARP